MLSEILMLGFRKRSPQARRPPRLKLLGRPECLERRTVLTTIWPMQPAPAIPIDSVDSVVLSIDADGNLRADEATVTFEGRPLNYRATVEGGWTAVAADVVAGVNTLAFRHSSGGLYFWRMDAAWRHVSGDSWTPPATLEFLTAEVEFGIDFDRDGTVGLPLVQLLVAIESAGRTELAHPLILDASPSWPVPLYVVEEGQTVGRPIMVGGEQLVLDPTHSWRPVAAERIDNVNTIVLRHSSGAIFFWRMDADWRHVSGDSWTTDRDPEFFTAEVVFGTDFNADGVVGSGMATTIEATGNVVLTFDGSGILRANGTPITYEGRALIFAELLAAGWTPVAADTAFGNRSIVLRHETGGLAVWRLGWSWNKLGSSGLDEDWVAPGSPGFFALETSYGMDFDRDGVLGLSLTTIEAAGLHLLRRDSGGNLWVSDRSGFLQSVKLAGQTLTHHAAVAAGWTPVAADLVDGVSTLVLKHVTGGLYFWRMSLSWEQVSGDSWTLPGTAGFQAAEMAFGVDFDGNGGIGT